MNQDTPLHRRDEQEAKEVERDGILICQACGERPASVTLMLGDVLGVVEVCYRCGHRILATAQADEVDDD
jgi:DNA-directed RNA polymerase subunit RPC12/RpoP